LAREQFGLVMPGEIAYVAVVPEGDAAEEVPPVAVGFTEERPWWKAFWDFITGSDLVTDG